ncbi:hypothetical protein B1L11_06875 [Microbispora sp. GKU 823]|nr:hypothetical protein B1L11_06875 [Microbispora sp. GKU 823]
MLKEEQISPEIQKAAVTNWAQRNGRKIVRWVIDLDATGRNFHRKIMEAIAGVEAGEAKEIAAWKYNRFGRNRTGNAINLARLHNVGGELQSATEDIDATTAIGKLQRGMLLEFAAFESDRAGEQWAEAHQYRRSRGLPSHGRARFGYVLRGRIPDPLQPHRTIRAPQDGPERYEIDPRTGPVLAELYRRYTAGEGARQLVAWANAAGVASTQGRPWSTSTLLRYLDTGFGAGLIKTHDPQCGCGNAARCRRIIHLKGAHEPVITEEEWQAYRRRRERVAKTAPRARVTVYPLTGRIWCGHCRATMTVGEHKGVKAARYNCSAYMRKGQCGSRSVQRARVEELVLGVLAQWAEDIEADPGSAPAPALEAQIDVSGLEGQIRRLDAALDRLTRQLALELVPEDTYKRTRDDLLAERAELVAQVDELQRPAPRSRHAYVPVIQALVAEWPTLRPVRRRELMAELIDSVHVFRTDPRTAWLEITSTWGDKRQVSV